MKKSIISLLFVLLYTGLASAQSDSINEIKQFTFQNDSIGARPVTLEMADSSYINGDYTTAVALYEEILENQGFSPELYLNLGNSYFKIDQTAKAILNYERAYLLDPSDNDVRFNLELARTKIVDKEVVVNEFFITTWLKKLSTSLNVNQWSVLILVLFALTAVILCIFALSKRSLIKKVSFGMSIVLLLFVILGIVFASIQKNSINSNDSAIIMAPSVTVKSTPNESGTDLFIIHDGRKVKIIDAGMKEWVEIRLNDGNEGWVPVDVLEII